MVPEFPISDGRHTITATLATLPASASKNSMLIQHIICAPSSLLIDKQILAVLVDIDGRPVVMLSSWVVLTKILRPLLEDSGRGLKCDGPWTTGPYYRRLSKEVVCPLTPALFFVFVSWRKNTKNRTGLAIHICNCVSIVHLYPNELLFFSVSITYRMSPDIM